MDAEIVKVRGVGVGLVAVRHACGPCGNGGMERRLLLSMLPWIVWAPEHWWILDLQDAVDRIGAQLHALKSFFSCPSSTGLRSS